jgi:hypothetical protein
MAEKKAEPRISTRTPNSSLSLLLLLNELLWKEWERNHSKFGSEL